MYRITNVLIFFALLLSCTQCQAAVECPLPSVDEWKVLDESLDGSILLPDDTGYKKAAEVLYPNFNSEYAAIVYPQSEQDVVKCVKFAREHQLVVSLRSTGHSFVGRSSGRNTMNINMSTMKSLSVKNPDPDSDTGISVSTQTGNNMIEIYEEIDKYDHRVVVGGSAHTVSPGGYFMGGGHSPLSTALGLGVDSLLSINIVTATGDLLRVSSSDVKSVKEDGTETVVEDVGDLWWSLRGGGHGMGVVTSFTLKAHPAVEAMTQLVMLSVMEDPWGTNVGQKILNELSILLKNSEDNEHETRFSGYILADNTERHVEENNPFSAKYKGILTIAILYRGSLEAGNDFFKPLYDFAKPYTFYRSINNFTTFLDYEKTASDTTGFNTMLVNSFLRSNSFGDESEFTQIFSSLVDTEAVMGCTGTILGGQVSSFPTSSSSVSEDFRKSRMSVSCGVSWIQEEHEQPQVQRMLAWAKKYLYKYGSGVYVNEPDYYLDDWKTEFWGSSSNYDRLLRVKQRWDPNTTFYCYQCAGSDVTGERMDVIKACVGSATSASFENVPGCLVFLFWIVVCLRQSCDLIL